MFIELRMQYPPQEIERTELIRALKRVLNDLRVESLKATRKRACLC